MGWKVGPTTSVLVFNLPFLAKEYSSSIKMVVSLQYSEDGLRMRIGKSARRGSGIPTGSLGPFKVPERGHPPTRLYDEAWKHFQRRSANHSIAFSLPPNLGPQVVCFPHVDCANLPFGLCAVTAVGDFDPSKGGHLVLWDCKLLVEFPLGSTILILSAVLAHSNTKVAIHEKRFSFTQYAAGGLFRWVDHAFQTLASYRGVKG